MEAAAGLGSKSKWKTDGSAMPYLCLVFFIRCYFYICGSLDETFTSHANEISHFTNTEEELRQLQRKKTVWERKVSWEEVVPILGIAKVQCVLMSASRQNSVHLFADIDNIFFHKCFATGWYEMIWRFCAKYYESTQRPRNIQCPTALLQKWHQSRWVQCHLPSQ